MTASICSTILWPTQHELRNTIPLSAPNFFLMKAAGSEMPSLVTASYSR